jgi:hypothetical protein
MAVPAAAGYFGGKALNASAPLPPDYMGLAQQQAAAQQALLAQQTQANRPNQSTPWATSSWNQGPDGQWSQQLGFAGPLGGAAASLQQQAAQAMGTPFSLSGLGALGTGDSARQQAIDSAYNQATSRLNPEWSQREEQLRTRLANQGLQEGSAAYNREMDRLSQGRNDAYGGAMANAIAQGTAAGSAVFNQNLASRQQALSELLRQRGQPLAELQSMQGLLTMPGFNSAGLGQAPNLLAAGGMQGAADFARWQQQQQQIADLIGGGTQLLGTAATLAPFLSDERAKVEVQRLPEEVVPGVPAALFRYRPEMGLGSALHLGVVAQDLARVHPEAVRTREDGLLEVHPAFAPIPLE